MTEFATVLAAVLPVFGIIGVGLLLRKLEWLTEEADQSLLRVTLRLLVPCLILDSTLGNAALTQWRNLLLAPTLGFGSVAVGMAIAALTGRWHGLRDRGAARTFVAAVGIYNYGYVPLPLAMLLFDKATVGVLFVFMLGVEVALWTLGVMVLTGQGLGQNWRQALNAPLLALLLALVLNALGGEALAPGPVRTALHWLGQCAIPMALILIGAVMADHAGEFHSHSGWRVMGCAVLLRNGLLPALFLGAASLLPASRELRHVLVLEAAMPAAVFPIIMSRHYGGDPPTALRVVVSTSLVGLVSIPLWIRAGLSLLGR